MRESEWVNRSGRQSVLTTDGAPLHVCRVVDRETETDRQTGRQVSAIWLICRFGSVMRSKA